MLGEMKTQEFGVGNNVEFVVLKAENHNRVFQFGFPGNKEIHQRRFKPDFQTHSDHVHCRVFFLLATDPKTKDLLSTNQATERSVHFQNT